MNPEEPIDLQPLDPGDLADIGKGAVRRFRVHVVLFTVDAVVGAVVLS